MRCFGDNTHHGNVSVDNRLLAVRNHYIYVMKNLDDAHHRLV